MSFVNIFILLAIFVGAVEAAPTVIKAPGNPLNLNVSFSVSTTTDLVKKQGYSQLRGASSMKDTVELKDWKFLDGYLEMDNYGDKQCSAPVKLKTFYQLNLCAYNSDLYYVKLVLVEDGGNGYKLGNLYYSDSNCENRVNKDFTPIPAKSCDDGTTYVHRPTLPDLSTLGMSFGRYYFADSTSCAAFTSPVIVQGLRKNACYSNGEDVFYNGCDNTGRLVGTYYRSTDLTCKSIPSTIFRFTSGDDCNEGFNFQCFA